MLSGLFILYGAVHFTSTMLSYNGMLILPLEVVLPQAQVKQLQYNLLITNYSSDLNRIMDIQHNSLSISHSVNLPA